jgi:hypothetical protein
MQESILILQTWLKHLKNAFIFGPIMGYRKFLGVSHDMRFCFTCSKNLSCDFCSLNGARGMLGNLAIKSVGKSTDGM